MRGPDDPNYNHEKIPDTLLSKFLCFVGIHFPGVYWPRNPQRQRVFYWCCRRCRKVVRGGREGYYYIDSANYGEQDFRLSKTEIQAIIDYDKQQPPELPDGGSYDRLTLDDIKRKFE